MLPSAAVSDISTTSGKSQSGAYSVQGLLGVPLFGVAPVDPVAVTDTPENVQKSALKIKVVGLVAGDDDGLGVAVLTYGGKTKVYGVGEKIEVPGSVKLLAVHADHIIIENNRKREKIELDKRDAIRGVTRAAAAPASAAETSDSIDLNDPQFKALIGDARDTLQNSPLKLARYFAVSPMNENGKLVGYSIKPGRDARLFEILDLQSGDVLLAVNGQSLGDIPPTELLKLMENTSSFELLVDRNGTILSKRLDL